MSEIECAMLVLGIGVLAFAVSRLQSIRRLRHWRLLAASYSFLLIGWAATTLEALFAHESLNFIEHAAYVVGAILAAIWCWLGPRDLAEAS